METKSIGEYSLKEIQSILLIILKEFDRICRKYNISYSLDGETLLGAVRHQGFIPWDDDIDVVMLRKDYQKFIKVCRKELDKSLYILDTTKNSKIYSYNFAKLKMNGVEFHERGAERVKEHKGLFIDIFPLDNTNSLFFKFQSKLSYMWQVVRWEKIGREYISKHSKLIKMLAKIIPLKLVNLFAEISMRFCNFLPTKKVCKLCNYSKGKEPHNRDYYSNLIEHIFEDSYFFIP